jgi:hypothetical protein
MNFLYIFQLVVKKSLNLHNYAELDRNKISNLELSFNNLLNLFIFYMTLRKLREIDGRATQFEYCRVHTPPKYSGF